MRFFLDPEGEPREVLNKTHRLGGDWIAAAVLLPNEPGGRETLLRTGSTRTAVQLRSETEEEAIDRMGFILEKVYGCSRVD